MLRDMNDPSGNLEVRSFGFGEYSHALGANSTSDAQAIDIRLTLVAQVGLFSNTRRTVRIR